jgi:hypothetical protein
MIECAYCGAKFFFPGDDRYLSDRKKPKEPLLPNENIKKSGSKTTWNSPFSDSRIYKNNEPTISLGTIIAIFVVGFFVFAAIAAVIASKEDVRQVRSLPTPPPYTIPTPPPIPPINIPKLPEPNVSSEETSPLFDISYRVSWDSSIPEQHIELPTLKDADFPSEDLKTLQKTVFAQKIIRVKVKINTNGEVTDAKAVSGHEILKEAAENAARASFFAERKKPLNTVMIYYFQIKQVE